MKVARLLTIPLLFVCTSLAAFSSSVQFTNNDGTFTSTGITSGTLTLSGSTLVGITGLTPYVPDTYANPPSLPSIGSLSLTTGAMNPGGNILTGATFGSGGNIMFAYTNGVVFTGSFSSASWTYNANTMSYTFVGTVSNGTLTVPGYSPVTIGTAVTVDLTTVGGSATASGSGYSFEDNGGTTNFQAPSVLTPVPEPGTLTLLGGGLVGIAIFVRRRGSRKVNSPE